MRSSLPAYPSRQQLARWARRARDWAYYEEAACIFQLDDLPAAAGRQPEEPLPAGYSLRLASPGDLPACALLTAVQLSEYERRLKQGDRCYLIEWEGQPVNVNWLHLGTCYVRGLGLQIDASPTECYVYNVFTAPAHRGRGLYKRTQRTLIGLLAAQGVVRIRQVVALHNAVPLAALPKLGYSALEWIQHRRLCGLNFTTVHNAGGHRLRRLSWKQPNGAARI